MPRRLPLDVRVNLEKCRSAALCAVDTYNRPGAPFKTYHFIVMIVIAWTALFHALFFLRRVKPWYRSRSHKGRYETIDGEYAHWDLTECLRQYYTSDNGPQRKNLEFLIGLRNRIEHRSLPELDTQVFGVCQSALYNLEELVVAEFGGEYALESSLAFSMQFSKTVPADRQRARRSLATSHAETVQDYIDAFVTQLSPEVVADEKFSYSVYLLPKTANHLKSADASMEFIREDDLDADAREGLRKFTTIIKSRQVPVTNLGLMKPGAVREKVQERIPYVFSMSAHTDSWKHFKVRPSTSSSQKHLTNTEYCVYDEPNDSYLYTGAWVEHLVLYLSTEDGFKKVIGRKPEYK